MAKIFLKINEAVKDGELEEVVGLVEEALEDGESPMDIMNEGLVKGMNTVGELFKEGEMFVPEVLMSANAMEAGMEVIRPLLSEGDIQKAGKIVFCTVAGDLHDIGKKLCVMMLEGKGYKVTDLGTDVSTDEMIDAIQKEKPDIAAMSAMLTTTMVQMDQTVERMKAEGLYDKVKVMIGGAPLSGSYADGIGAVYSEDAVTCVETANRILEPEL